MESNKITEVLSNASNINYRTLKERQVVELANIPQSIIYGETNACQYFLNCPLSSRQWK